MTNSTAQPLTIVANIYAKPDNVEQVKTALNKLVPATREEPGCVQYDLHQNNENPAHFMMYEVWQDTPSWHAHMEAEALKTYLVEVDGAIESFTVDQMTQVAR
ncbi:antibiotic biosynthesis monooxygenase [Thalassotalea euphylliae]|uniref:Antibiotic biosynthesis monooxygenase n=1 Tax=Thalassotalea euphylliae TaxID=1655234 RepID=A0A3E0TNY1_9GAMM|nr:putative quinol monooxygenase [Thalassotalea euphylliae]REL26259.1 antibiotic biosynthesis monooxygenase [Thalassotalea euphylliae]